MSGPGMRADLLSPISPADVTNTLQLFEPFFGKPRGGPIVVDPYEGQSNQNYDLPDAYKGKNTYLSLAVEHQMLNDDDFYTQVLLPVKVARELSLKWDKWVFDQTRMGVVPEEAPSRLISSRYEEKTANMIRQGIAMQMEHGFMTTEKGVRNYAYNLIQMGLAVKETLKVDIINAYLTAEDVNREHEKRTGHYNRRTIRIRLNMDRDNWARVQKDEMGLAKLDAQSDEEMARYQGRADTWVLPAKMRLFAKFQPHETDYYLSGRTWSLDSKEIFGIVNNKKAYILRQFEIAAANLADISSRQRQIGEYYTMVDRFSRSRTEQDVYTSEERSIKIYNEAQDCWTVITLSTAMNHLPIWDKDGKLLPVDSNAVKATSDAPNPNDKSYDFLSLKDGSPIQVFGQFKESHFGTPSMIGMARTAVASLGLTTKEIDEVSELLSDLVTDNTPATPAGLEGLLTNATFANGNLRSFDIDLYKSTNANMHLPSGGQYYDLVVPTAAGATALSPKRWQSGGPAKFLDGLTRLFPGSIVLSPKNLPAIQTIGQSVRSLPGQNIVNSITGRFLPVWFRGTAGTAAGADNKLKDTLRVQDASNVVTLQALLPLIRNLDANGKITQANIDGLGNAVAGLFGFENRKFEDYANQPGRVGVDDDLTRAVAFFQILSAQPLNADGTANGGASASRTMMPNVASQARFIIRSRLVALLQQLTIRIIGSATSDAGLAALKGVVDNIATLATNAPVNKVRGGEAKNDLPTGGYPASNSPKAAWKLIITKAKAKVKEYEDANNIKGLFPGEFEDDKFLDKVEAQDGPIAQTIANVLQEPQAPAVATAFYITPIFLTIAQADNLLTNILAGAATDDAIAKALATSRFTISNPDDLSKPILTAAEVKAVRAMITNGSLKEKFGWTSDSFDRSLSGMIMKVANQNKNKRGAVKEAAPEGGNKRSRRGAPVARDHDDDDEVDAMDTDAFQNIDVTRVTGGITIKIGASDNIPNLLGSGRYLKRLARLDQEMVDPLYRLVARVIASAPITRDVCRNLIANNVVFPMSIIVAAPHMNYTTHLAIKTLAGDQTGNSYIGHINFEVGDDPVVKMHHAHLTLYSKPIITEPKNVRVFYDIYSGECLGGAGAEPIDITQYSPKNKKFGNGHLLFLPEAYEVQSFPNPLDLSGHFSYFKDMANRDRDDDIKPHYSTSYRLNRMFGWRIGMDEQKFDVEQIYHPIFFIPNRAQINYNTVCYHATEFYFNRVTKVHDIEHKGTGHWGHYAFPGCRSLRDGSPTPWAQALQNSAIRISSH